MTEPIVVDDENLTKEGIKEQANPTKSRICAFVAAIRLHVILEVSPCVEGFVSLGDAPLTVAGSDRLLDSTVIVCHFSVPRQGSIYYRTPFVGCWVLGRRREAAGRVVEAVTPVLAL